MRIAPGLYRLGVVGVNVYAWRDEAKGLATGNPAGPILFDCGWPWSARDIGRGLAALEFRPTDIRTIALTHFDFDHVGQLAALAAASGAEVVAHRLEAKRIEGGSWRRLPGSPASLDINIIAAPALYRRWAPQPVPVTRAVEDGAEIGDGWLAVHTPGHTPGHTAFFHPRLRLLIAGDALGSPRRGRLRAPKPAYCEDQAAAARSIRKLAALEPEVICFGHGPELRQGATAALHALAASIDRDAARNT